MSAKVHLHMHVSDLSRSRDFYEKFLGGDPVKVKQGYVKFLPEWAPVNLALSTGGPIGAGTIDHVGVQVDSVETVMAQLARVKDIWLAVTEELGVDCCHANQDKFWVKDPDGVECEVYHLNYDPRARKSGWRRGRAWRWSVRARAAEAPAAAHRNATDARLVSAASHADKRAGWGTRLSDPMVGAVLALGITQITAWESSRGRSVATQVGAAASCSSASPSRCSRWVPCRVPLAVRSTATARAP